MTEEPSKGIGKRPTWVVVLTLLLFAQAVSILTQFQYFAWARTEVPFIRLFAAILGLVAIVTLFGVWTRKAWAPWAVLALASLKLVVDLMAWALNVDAGLALLSAVANVLIISLAFRYELGAGPRVIRPMKIFFAFVLILAAWVGLWGLVIPARVDKALPLLVPPLHARLFGAMYWSGAAFMIAAILAKSWAEIRVVTAMTAIWTGTLAIVSLLNLRLFIWSLPQTWVWFGAYIAFAVIAAWITSSQRFQDESPVGRELPAPVRGYLYGQGALLTVLATLLLLAPTFMSRVWPWAIFSELAQIYSAPFFAYGLGSLLAARQRTWAEARFAIYGTLVFAVLALIASFLHSSLFDFNFAPAWIWFGGLMLITGILALFSLALPSRSEQPA